MPLPSTLVNAPSKVGMRLHRWQHAARLLARADIASCPPALLDRLSYALLCAGLENLETARGIFRALLGRNNDRLAHLPAERLLVLAEAALRVELPARAERLLTLAAQSEGEIGAAATCLLHLTRDTLEGALRLDLVEALDTLDLGPAGSPLVLAPLSSAYLDMASLWLEQTQQHVAARILLLAMDDASIAFAAEHNVLALDLRHRFCWVAGKLQPQSRGALWMLRVFVLRELVRRGHPTLVLDLDAMPVGDVFSMLRALPAADILAQKDHSIPMEVERLHGFVLCCGFLFARPTPAALALLDRFAARTSVERDDQLALNHLLAKDGLVGRTEDAEGLRFGSAGVQFVCPPTELVSRSLTGGTVVRHFHQQGQTTAELRAALSTPAR